ncbi:MAG TPA: Hsp70 family protein [Pirellulales bacterium]|nr:Hsp70 family protein [Pirellulales bacterium]
MTARYAIGIDLGTTNSALAYCALEGDAPRVELLNVPQLVAPATIEERALLPSFLYLGGDADAKAKNFDLPWEKKREFAVGELARRQAADVPTRTVAAAKSWLCHSRVDRHQPILPWNAPADVPKVSPVAAATRYLAHLAAAWQAAFRDAPIADQHVVLTVPASFDPAARELTREAALAAGLPESLVLLEEPQAAVYAWLADEGDRWRKQMKVGDRLLVCDVGGGTTDFTLVGVTEEAGNLMLTRLAVGNHILVGGDNMDLALAHYAAGMFTQKGVQLDPWQSVALWHSCRAAKEVLLAGEAPKNKKHPISVLGRGSKLIKGTVSVEVEREAAGSLLVEGFLPQCDLNDGPAPRRASGFRELGLPFETDTAITRHLAAFLRAQGEQGQAARPTHVLFNGGVFKSTLLRERLFSVMSSWFPGQPPQGMTGNEDLDYAVARGAAYYGFAKQRKAVRIRGGTARSYYVGIETAGLAIPGAARPLRALCVVPFGMEEGTESNVPGDEIGLVVGEPAQFRFFSSAVRKDDRPGTLLNSWTDAELAETDPLVATLPASEEAEEGFAPVRFQSRITELGMFELWCHSSLSDHRWKLEFSVRDEGT